MELAALVAPTARRRDRQPHGRERGRRLRPAARHRAQLPGQRQRLPGADVRRGAERDRRGVERRQDDPRGRRLHGRSRRADHDLAGAARRRARHASPPRRRIDAHAAEIIAPRRRRLPVADRARRRLPRHRGAHARSARPRTSRACSPCTSTSTCATPWAPTWSTPSPRRWRRASASSPTPTSACASCRTWPTVAACASAAACRRAASRPKSHSGEEVRDGIVAASRFAELDPYRAATHNKGIMNGVDAVVIATGNDWRGVEAGAHAFAADQGRARRLRPARHLARRRRRLGRPRRPHRAADGRRHRRRHAARPSRARGWRSRSSASSAPATSAWSWPRRAWRRTWRRCARWPPKASRRATCRCTRARWRCTSAPPASSVDRVAEEMSRLGDVRAEVAHADSRTAARRQRPRQHKVGALS